MFMKGSTGQASGANVHFPRLTSSLIKTLALYVNGTLRSWVHYIELRSGNGTQKEHIELARACAEAIAKIFPMIEEFVHD